MDEFDDEGMLAFEETSCDLDDVVEDGAEDKAEIGGRGEGTGRSRLGEAIGRDDDDDDDEDRRGF